MKNRFSFMLGLLLSLTAFLWVMTLRSRMETLALDQEIIAAEKKFYKLSEQEQALLSQLYTPSDLAENESALLSAGMVKPRREQLIYTELVLPDKVTVVRQPTTLGEKIRSFFPFS